MKTVVAFGTFDILHPGHLSYLKSARSHGDRLVVVISRDATVQRSKGRKPLFSESERRAIVSSLSFVDDAVLGGTGNLFSILKTLRPDVIALGYDHPVRPTDIGRECKKLGLTPPKVVRANAAQPSRFKSSALKKRLGL